MCASKILASPSLLRATGLAAMHGWVGWTEVPSLPRVACLGTELHANTSFNLSHAAIWFCSCFHFTEEDSESQHRLHAEALQSCWSVWSCSRPGQGGKCSFLGCGVCSKCFAQKKGGVRHPGFRSTWGLRHSDPVWSPAVGP